MPWKPHCHISFLEHARMSVRLTKEIPDKILIFVITASCMLVAVQIKRVTFECWWSAITAGLYTTMVAAKTIATT